MVTSQQNKDALRAHAAAVIESAEFFQKLARRIELPLTETEFEERVAGFFKSLDERLAISNAVVMAVFRDEPMPQSAYAMWASPTTIWQWRSRETDPLPYVVLTGKVMIKPTDFFAALKKYGAD